MSLWEKNATTEKANAIERELFIVHDTAAAKPNAFFYQDERALLINRVKENK
jgi:hypothetical protein